MSVHYKIDYPNNLKLTKEQTMRLTNLLNDIRETLGDEWSVECAMFIK